MHVFTPIGLRRKGHKTIPGKTPRARFDRGTNESVTAPSNTCASVKRVQPEAYSRSEFEDAIFQRESLGSARPQSLPIHGQGRFGTGTLAVRYGNDHITCGSLANPSRLGLRAELEFTRDATRRPTLS